MAGNQEKIIFVCGDCGAEHLKWQGQCNSCGVWNTLSQFRPGKPVRGAKAGYTGSRSQAMPLSEVSARDAPRRKTGFGELDRVLGGGIVPGSVILLAGNPGAGKSTLLLQMAAKLEQESAGVLYVTGEESLQQLALRATRLGLPANQLHVMVETDVDSICDAARERGPALLVVDSIQVMQCRETESAAGSVSQVRESAARFVQFAKQHQVSVLLAGHVTKEGGLAGPRVLEHMIDCFIMLDGDSDKRYRLLRGHKNRFGAVNELGVFAMTDKGLREVPNPSALFLSRGQEDISGSTVLVLWEGTRPLLVEIQALVDDNSYSQPRRVALGVDHNRLAMLLAVLSRHGGVQLAGQDVYINVAGGIRITETSSDLALLASVVSSLRNQPLPRDLIVFGELGLSGEVRPVPNGQVRLMEAAKHGFRRAIVPDANKPRKPIEGLQVHGTRKLADALSLLRSMTLGN